jgi:cobalt-precorrin 5A hydrolase
MQDTGKRQPEQQDQRQEGQQNGSSGGRASASRRRRIAVVYLTPAGGDLARRLERSWPDAEAGARPAETACAPSESSGGRPQAAGVPSDGDGDRLEVLQAARPLTAMMPDLWHSYDSLIFIMAVGIVVRLIAPLLESKWRDPGVVVVDEGGNFAVSLVGGHWGEANRLAREVAACLGAAPVVTTATDVQGKPGIDLLAKQWGFRPVPGERVKAVNSALLAGERVAIYTEWDLSGEIPAPESEAPVEGETSGCGRAPGAGMELFSCHSLQEMEQGHPEQGQPNPDQGKPGPDRGKPVAVLVTSRVAVNLPAPGLYLRPPSLAAGIGCRRGVAAAEIEAALDEALRLAGRSRDSLALLASHEVKADEAGLLEAARRLGLALRFFGSERLEQVFRDHPGLQHSHFVQRRLGVGGVCEAASLAAIPDGTLVLPKTKCNRVTVALAEAGWLWSASGRVIRRI